MKLLILALSLVTATAAYADAPPLAGDQHEPPMFIDERSIDFQLASSDGGFHPSVAVDLYGVTRGSDGVRLEWKQNGKLLGTQKCELLSKTALGANAARVDCAASNIPTLKVSGAVVVDLIYIDDSNDKRYLVRSFKLNIAKWMQEHDTPNFAVLPDDALGIAFYAPDKKNEHPTFSFWTTASIDGDTNLRCKVDGKPIDDFQSALTQSASGEIEIDDLPKSGPRLRFTFKHPILRIDDLFVGNRADFKGATDKMRFPGDTPGAWSCDVRVEGKVLRTLTFTVDAKGVVQPDDIQRSKSMFKLPPNVLPIAIAIPKGVDPRMRPAAMKASLNFGLPWPEHPNVKKWQAAFPPQLGADPK